MATRTIFDQYGAVTARRMAFLGALLPDLVRAHGLATALDVGCGVGEFSEFLRQQGLAVAGADARAENVAEAHARHPSIPFHVADVEDPAILGLGPRDLVLCFGLLYHLENPFRAVRHLRALTGEVLMLESMVFPSRFARAALVDEVRVADQGLRYVALVPSEACLVAMLFRAGFGAVYRPARLPDHQDFRASLPVRRRRTVLIAARSSVAAAGLQPVRDRPPQDPWARAWAQPALRVLRRLRRAGAGGPPGGERPER